MEELRTTEVLEAEILEDARKKAARILRTADDSLAAQKRSWEKKLADDLESIRKAYMDRMKKSIEDIFARFPLDKRRLRLKTHEEFLSGAINAFLSNLDHEKLLFILERELSQRLMAVAENVNAPRPSVNNASASRDGIDNTAASRAVVRYSGLSVPEARDLLGKTRLPFSWDFLENFSTNDLLLDETSADPIPGGFPSIVIDTETFRLSASVESAAAALLKDNREELASALLGREVIND